MRKPTTMLSALCLAAIAAATAAPAIATPADERFIAAMRLYHDARYAAAYGRLIELADQGHADAAAVCLLMLHHGPQLYRSQWSATQPQVRRWQALASQRLPPLSVDAGD